MARRALAASLAALVAACATPASAQGEAAGASAPSGPAAGASAPSAQDRVRAAAAEYDAGRRAFLQRSYGDAAAHFESAFHAAPIPATLRNAIRARRDAKQLARAATLAALGERLYPEDVATMVVVHDTLSAATPRLYRVNLTCAPSCAVASGGAAITLDDTRALTFFLEPGARDVAVTWPGDKTRTLSIRARAGRREDIAVEAPADAPPPAVADAPPPPPVAPLPPPSSGEPLGPGVFAVGLGLTAVGAGATVVSAIDPGHQGALSAAAATRTYVLLGVTGGVAVTTAVIGVFFTRWSSPVQPGVAVGPDLRAVSLAGRF